MAHTETWGITVLRVDLDTSDSSDWVCSKPVRTRSYGFTPAAIDDVLVLGEYQGDATIVGLPLSSSTGDPIGMHWDSEEKLITPAVDISESTLSGATPVLIIISPLT